MYCIEKNKILTKEFLEKEIGAGKRAKDIALEHSTEEQAVSWYIRKHGLLKNKRKYEFKDWTGVKVGSVEIIERGKNIIRGKNHVQTWVGRCECGNVQSYEIHNLRKGKKSIENGIFKDFSCGCKRMLAEGEHARKRVFWSYKHGAKVRGYEFAISFDDFLFITKQDCHYCGEEPSNIYVPKSKNGSFTYNGIDREDNNVGYVFNNIVPCCTRCNRAKMVMGKDEFLEWIERVYNHSFGEKEYNKLKIV